MSKILKGLNEVNPNNYDSDWDYQDAVAKSGKSRSNYRSQEDDTSDADIAYSKKMYQLGQKQKAAKEKAQRDSDHNRLASGTNEGSDNPWGDQGNFVGDTPQPNIGGTTVKRLQVGDTVKYLGQLARIDAMSKTGNTSRITIGNKMGGVTQDVLTTDLKRINSGMAEAGTGLDIDRSIPGRTIARISGDIKHRTGSPSGKKLPDYHPDDDYDQWSGKVDPSIHDDEEDTFNTDYTGDEEGELKEISNEKLAQYKTAAALDAGKADKEGDYKRGDKRFSGIVKATKKQFANDTKKSNISQGMAEADEKPVEPFKTGYPRVNNPQILGTQNRAKSIYHPPSKPNVKKLDKPLPENLGDELKSKSLEALQQVKQQLEQQRMADLEQWEKDFKQNTVAKFTAREPNLRQRATSTSMVAMPGEKHSDLKARLGQLNKAIEKQGILDNLVQKLDKKGLLTPNIEAGVDTSMLARDGARDNYVELNKKLDKALEYVKNRLLTNKAAYAKPKAIDEDDSVPTRMRMNDYMDLADAIQEKLRHAIQMGDKARIQELNKQRDELDAHVKKYGMMPEDIAEEQLDELSCWSGYHRVAGTKAGFPGSCAKNKTNEEDVAEDDAGDLEQRMINKIAKYKEHLAHLKKTDPAAYKREMEKHKQTNRIPPVSTFEGHSESCPHCGGEMISEELMNEKKDACYYKVKSRYKVWPSAYASGALVKCRNKGAKNWGNSSKNESSILEGIERADENLHQWFKEKWVRFGPDGKIRGDCARGDDSEGKPKCLPQSKAQNLGKKGRASAAQRKRREDPNPERSGKAINVDTKKSKG